MVGGGFTDKTGDVADSPERSQPIYPAWLDPEQLAYPTPCANKPFRYGYTGPRTPQNISSSPSL